jgi:hypothetical protein
VKTRSDVFTRWARISPRLSERRFIWQETVPSLRCGLTIDLATCVNPRVDHGNLPAEL